VIVYLDSSALVKRYVAERGSEEVEGLIPEAEALGTTLVSRAEIVAALAKAIRVGALGAEEALRARETFEGEWPDLVRLAISEQVVERAAEAAWDHGLRGYDALHLAAANTWKDLLQRPVALATFDRRLWQAAGDEGLRPWPDDLPALLDTWSRASLPPSADGGDTA
jgi:predicted nucleic acid-binding protein